MSPFPFIIIEMNNAGLSDEMNLKPWQTGALGPWKVLSKI